MQHRRPVANDAEPGTGTQYHYEATPPVEMDGGDDERPNTYRLNGTEWLVGHEYFDVERRELVELDAVVRKSVWCDVREPEDGKLLFRLQTDYGNTYEVSPEFCLQDENETDPSERFIKRRIRTPDYPGAPKPVWYR